MDHKFGRRARSVFADHQDDVFQPLLVTALHVREERGELVLAALPPALIDVMRDIVGQTIEHALPVTGVESGIIAFEQGKRCGAGHRSSPGVGKGLGVIKSPTPLAPRQNAAIRKMNRGSGTAMPSPFKPWDQAKSFVAVSATRLPR